eukprot:161524_1
MGCMSSVQEQPEGQCEKYNQPSILSPTTSIKKLFAIVGKDIGANKKDESIKKYIRILSQNWYYRCVDLLAVPDEFWKELNLPTVLKREIFNHITKFKQNEQFLNYVEPESKERNITVILSELLSENNTNSTSAHIDRLQSIFEKKYLLNVDKISQYFTKEEWNKIDVPTQLKSILAQIIRCDKFYQKQQKGELFHNADELMNDLNAVTLRDDYKIDPRATMNDICGILAKKLFMSKENVAENLQPILTYKYRRIYHLSLISDETFDKLLTKAAKPVKDELFNIITFIRQQHISLGFCRKTKRKKQKRESIQLDFTMTTPEIFSLLEYDLNLDQGALTEDVNILMTSFYANLWDLFFVSNEIWKSLPNYNRYEVLRIRMNHLFTECIKSNNMNGKRPTLPEHWKQQFDETQNVKQILTASRSKKFHFDKLDWNQSTIKTVNLLIDYLDKNLIKKLKYLPLDHSENNQKWTAYTEENKIPSHIRFKLNFYAINGSIQTDDIWLNEYIRKQYKLQPPQFKQGIFPMCFIKNVQAGSAEVHFLSINKNGSCDVEIMSDDEKQSKWKKKGTKWHSSSYDLEYLKPDTLYRVRAKYRNESLYSETLPFKTNPAPLPPIASVEDVHARSATIQFSEIEPSLEYVVEIINDEKDSGWNTMTTMRNESTYICDRFQPFTSYTVRCKYTSGNVYSAPISFKTKSAPFQWDKDTANYNHLLFEDNDKTVELRVEGGLTVVARNKISKRKMSTVTWQVTLKKIPSSGVSMGIGYTETNDYSCLNGERTRYLLGHCKHGYGTGLTLHGSRRFQQCHREKKYVLGGKQWNSSNVRAGDRIELNFMFFGWGNRCKISFNDTLVGEMKFDLPETLYPAITLFGPHRVETTNFIVKYK